MLTKVIHLVQESKDPFDVGLLGIVLAGKLKSIENLLTKLNSYSFNLANRLRGLLFNKQRDKTVLLRRM